MHGRGDKSMTVTMVGLLEVHRDIVQLELTGVQLPESGAGYKSLAYQATLPRQRGPHQNNPELEPITLHLRKISYEISLRDEVEICEAIVGLKSWGQPNLQQTSCGHLIP
jgi:hypothetical protein